MANPLPETQLLRVGISSCIFHPDKTRATFAPKTLLYYEQSMAHMLMRFGVFPVLVPTPTTSLDQSQIVAALDGLILAGGADVSPLSYGESSDRWPGDVIRDQYEIALYREMVHQNKPVLGICRGHQIINVAHGGTLYHDLATQHETKMEHRNAEKYDKIFHTVKFFEDSLLAQIYRSDKNHKTNPSAGLDEFTLRFSTNTVHHQAVKELGEDLVIEARCEDDEVIEGLRLKTSKIKEASTPFVLGVQWHPEFMFEPENEHMDQDPLLKCFLNEVSQRKR